MLLTDLLTDRSLLFTLRIAEDFTVEEGNHLGDQALTLIVVQLVLLDAHHL